MIARGVEPKKTGAEIFGKAAGLGGHMHILDANVNFACSGIVARGMGPAVGTVPSRKAQGKSGGVVS